MSSPSLLKLWISGTLLALTAVAQPTYTLTAFNANAVFTDPAGAAPGAAQGSGTGSPGRATFTATLAGQTVTGTMAISAPSPITGTISTAFRQIDGSGFRVLTPTTPQPFTITWSLTGAAQQGNLVVSTGVNFTRQTSTSTSFTVSPPEIVLSGTDQTASISAQVGFRFPSRPNVEVAFNALFQWAVAVGGRLRRQPQTP